MAPNNTGSSREVVVAAEVDVAAAEVVATDCEYSDHVILLMILSVNQNLNQEPRDRCICSAEQ